MLNHRTDKTEYGLKDKHFSVNNQKKTKECSTKLSNSFQNVTKSMKKTLTQKTFDKKDADARG